MINSKNDNLGLTIVEMLVSIIIISLVMSLLFTLLIQVKNANESSSAKSNLLISQAVITKTIEQDMVEIGVSAISNCSIGSDNTSFFDKSQVDSNEETACLRIEFNKTYSDSDVAYILIYKQSSSQFTDPAWIIRYSRGYYENCVKGNQPSTSSSWNETYTVVQRLESNINLSTPKAHITYSSDYDSSVKYTSQKVNSVNLNVPITDDQGYKYDLDFSFTYKIIPDDETVGVQDTDVFMCDNTNVSKGITCECVGNYCSHSYSTEREDSYIETDGEKSYRYYCKDTKALTNLSNGMNVDFLSISAVKRSGVNASNIATIAFSDKASVEGWDDPYDVSYVQNKSTKMFIRKNPDNSELYDILFCQSGGVTIYGNSISGMFRGFSNLRSIDLDGLITSGITNMSNLFYGCSKLKNSGLKGLSTLDFATVKNMNSMFGKCTGLSYSPFRTSDTSLALELPVVTNVDSMFQYSGLNSFTYGLDLNTPNVVNMNNLLANCVALMKVNFTSITLKNNDGNDVTINTLDKLKYLIGFCSECSIMNTVDISNFNFNSLQSIDSLFYKCVYLKSLNFKLNDLSDTLTSISGMFEGCGLVEINPNNVSFDMAYNTDASNLFTYCESLYKADLGGFRNINYASNIDKMFYYATKLEELACTGGNLEFYYATDAFTMFSFTVLRTGYNLLKFDNVTSCEKMFYGVRPKSGSNYVYIDLDFNNKGLTKCTNFSYMFYESTYRNISFGFEEGGSQVTSGTINLSYMFACNSSNYSMYLRSVNMFGCKFKTTVNCNAMFNQRDGLTLTHIPDDVYTLDLEQMKKYYEGDSEYRFYDESENYPFKDFMDSSYPSAQITSMYAMFQYCRSLKGIPEYYFSDFITSTSCNYQYMFKQAFSSSSAVDEINYKYSDMICYLDFDAVWSWSSQYNSMFEGCTNLAGISFKSYKGTSSQLWSSWGMIQNLGANSYQIIKTFTFEIKETNDNGLRYLFNGNGDWSNLPYATKICVIIPDQYYDTFVSRLNVYKSMKNIPKEKSTTFC